MGSCAGKPANPPEPQKPHRASPKQKGEHSSNRKATRAAETTTNNSNNTSNTNSSTAASHHAPPPGSSAQAQTFTTAAAPHPASSSKVPQAKGGEIVTHNPFPQLVDRDIGDYYVLGKELGRGEFGVTFLATKRDTGELLACKSIPKRKLRTAIDIEDVRREVAIMHHLPPHANIVGLKGVFEDRHAVHIVQELCEGGELFERIIARGHYSERQAAVITRTIVEVVAVCHRNGVMHRDLKPENFLFASQREDSPLRAIDFGLSIMFKPGESFSEIVGSPYYMAPEVLRKDYGPLADVWSAGVILYILLCGVPPFWAESEQGVAQAVLRGQVDLQRDPWPRITDSAKHLVMLLLEPNVGKRPTAEQVLQHPWLRDAQSAPDTPLGEIVFSRMKQLTTMNKLKKKALLVIADSLQDEEVQGLQEVFNLIDTDGSGTISLDELREGLKKIGSTLTESEVQTLMEAADLDGNGMIDYQEWVAATMHLHRVNNDKNLRVAFDYFDSDLSGFIDIEELADALGADLQTLKEILAEVDTNNDGKISYEEFVHMMKTGTEFRTASRHFSKSRSSLRSLLLVSDIDLNNIANPAY